MDSRFHSMSAEDFEKRLRRYKELSGIRTNREIAEIWGRSQGRVSDCARHEGLSTLKAIQDFSDAIDVPLNVFVGAFDEYSRFLEDKFTARWRDIVGCRAYFVDKSNAITHESATGRLVQPIANGDNRKHPSIRIGSSNRLRIDLLALLREHGIIKSVGNEIEFVGLNPTNGSAPLQDFFVYVLQIERTGCMLLRPNSHFSLSDDPRDNEDILKIEDLDNPCDSMNGLLYVPAPSRNRSNYMVFGGEPGISRIVLLIARWPAIHQTLKDALSNPNGADPRLLDELAANLKPSAEEENPSARHYWRICEQTYKLVG